MTHFQKRLADLLGAVVGLGIVVACFLFAGCSDTSVTAPVPVPTPLVGCPFTIGIEPLRTAGAYFVKATPPGPFTVYIGAQSLGAPDEGLVVYGTPGDIVSACRACGCAVPVPLL